MSTATEPSHASTPDIPAIAGLVITTNGDDDLVLGRESSSKDARLDASRRSTEPSPSELLQAHFQQRSRSRSPYARGHNRSHSAASALVAPPMTRTKSLPLVSSAADRSWSPSHSPVRPSSPMRQSHSTRPATRRSFEETRPSQATPGFMDIESIAEDSELEFAPRNLPASRETHSSPVQGNLSNTFPRFTPRKRPPSPLTQYSIPASLPASIAAPPRSASPNLNSAKFNEPFPLHPAPSGSFTLSTSSSVPSTPTSLRSRSPSISSLETIPDSPDAEKEATEAHHIARLKAAADAAEAVETDAETTRRLQKAGFDVRSMRVAGGLSTGQAAKDKRKRWSVCGAERRGDFEMETIWED